ncbi:MAG TPA: M48 family metallopeptidase [Paludibacteraceae bacterium]|nr:M48 family metallopeptidase [Paludibacteraceae bacterium]
MSERILSALNVKSSKKPIPDLLSGIYDQDKYQKQQSYFRANTRFGLLTSTVSFLVIILMIVFGGFGWLDGIVQRWTANPILVSLIFFGILFLANDIISTPFEIYDIFVIEERFGFNKTTPKTFILDKLKGYALTAVLGGGIIALVMWFYQLNPQYFWLIAWACVTSVSLFISLFYSELIVPLFNKQTPLEAGELRDAIEKFSKKAGFELKNIFVIDGSKRSTKANAYFTGFWKKKRIVLYDTLINDLDTAEIVAVLAHEAGHSKYKHTLRNILINLPYTLLVFFLLGLILRSDVLAQALGGKEASFHLNILAFGVLYSPVSMMLGLAMNVLSRKHEYQADGYVKENKMGEQLISALKKISSKSLSNLTPHPAYVFVNYSHPTLLQRVEKLTNSPVNQSTN